MPDPRLFLHRLQRQRPHDLRQRLQARLQRRHIGLHPLQGLVVLRREPLRIGLPPHVHVGTVRLLPMHAERHVFGRLVPVGLRQPDGLRQRQKRRLGVTTHHKRSNHAL